jgi:RNA polymerase sigma-70 factor, ECF subfamily
MTPTERTNDEWVAVLHGDGTERAAALEDLRIRLERGLFYYLSRERSDLAERSPEELQQMAQDFTQDALLKVLENLDSFRGESQFTTWSAKIAARVAISELRRSRWKDYSLDGLTAEGDIMPAGSSSKDMTSGMPPRPEDYTERQDVLKLIDDAINEALTERQRTALLAHAVDGLPVEEIARKMDTNRNALYKLIHDARLKLRRHLEQQGISAEYLGRLFEVE